MLAVLGLMFLGFDPSVLTIPPEMMVVPELPKEWTRDDVRNYAIEIAKEYGLKTQKFLDVIKCENNFEAKGQSNHYYKGVRENSWGVAQFHNPETDWNMTIEEAENPEIALPKMAQAWLDGLAPRWSCWHPG